MKDAITESGADIQGSISDIAGKAAGWPRSLASIRSGGMALVNILSLLIVTPDRGFLSSDRLGSDGCQGG